MVKKVTPSPAERLGPAGHPAADLLVSFVRVLRVDHGADWVPAQEDYAAALTLLRAKDWTWGWAWFAAIGFVERSGPNTALIEMVREAPAYVEVGRTKFMEFSDRLKYAGGAGGLLSGDSRVNSYVVMHAENAEKLGAKAGGPSRARLAGWFPPEWRSILWLQIRIADHEPNPHAPYVGEQQRVESKAEPANDAKVAPQLKSLTSWKEITVEYEKRTGRLISFREASRQLESLGMSPTGKPVVLARASFEQWVGGSSAEPTGKPAGSTGKSRNH